MDSRQIDQVRSEFPALAGNTVFLDNAGGSQVLRRVANRIHEYLLTSSVQLGASYSTSELAGARVLTARRAVATLVNAEFDDEVVMGGATTALLYMLVQALLPGIRPGDEIIVTDTDHEANIGAWMRMRQAGAVVNVWAVNRDTLTLELDDLQVLLNPQVKWLAMTHASNILGTVNAVRAAADRVHAVGGRLCVDAVAYAPHRLVDVQASGADVYVYSFYKVFGPHFAVMWVRREVLMPLPSLNHYFIAGTDVPYKLQLGNVNYELSYGCIGIADYLRDMGTSFGATGAPRARMQAAFEVFERHEDELAERLLSYLRNKRCVRIIGMQRAKAHGRVPTVSFVVPQLPSEQIVRHVDRFGIGIRFGDFYAKRLIEALGLGANGGVVRISIAHYNTLPEIDRLIHHLDEVLP